MKRQVWNTSLIEKVTQNEVVKLGLLSSFKKYPKMKEPNITSPLSNSSTIDQVLTSAFLHFGLLP